MKKYCTRLMALLIILVATTTTTFAQREETLMNSSGFGFSGAWGGFTTNIGQFDGKYAGYQGGMWALEFGKRFFIGGTNYTLPSQVIGKTTKTFSMVSNNLLLGYTPKAYMPVHPIFSLGVGGSRVRVRTDGNTIENNVFMLHPAVGAELNITRWCHLDAQVGYRAVMNSDFVGLADKDFSGLYGQINLKFGYSWGRYRSKNKSDDKL